MKHDRFGPWKARCHLSNAPSNNKDKVIIQVTTAPQSGEPKSESTKANRNCFTLRAESLDEVTRYVPGMALDYDLLESLASYGIKVVRLEETGTGLAYEADLSDFWRKAAMTSRKDGILEHEDTPKQEDFEYFTELCLPRDCWRCDEGATPDSDKPLP